MTTLPTWLHCRADKEGYARVDIYLDNLSFDHAQYLSAPLAQRVAELDRHSVLLDLSGVVYLSSDVMGALLHLSRRLRERDGKLILANAGEIVQMVFTPFQNLQKQEPNNLAAFLFLDAPIGFSLDATPELG